MRAMVCLISGLPDLYDGGIRFGRYAIPPGTIASKMQDTVERMVAKEMDLLPESEEKDGNPYDRPIDLDNESLLVYLQEMHGPQVSVVIFNDYGFGSPERGDDPANVKPTIYVNIEGGMIRNVIASNPVNAEVCIIDWDLIQHADRTEEAERWVEAHVDPVHFEVEWEHCEYADVASEKVERVEGESYERSMNRHTQMIDNACGY